MSSTQIVFPLSEIQAEFLQARNQRAHAMVEDAVKKVALDANVPPNLSVAPNKELTALVVVEPEPEQAPDQTPCAPPAADDEWPTDADLESGGSAVVAPV